MSNSENIQVSVVIPCRNEIRFIRGCLDSILSQDTAGIKLEILIADGMSDDGTRAVLHGYEKNVSSLRVLDNLKKNASAGLNLAIRAATSEIIIRMDAHTEYAPDYIRNCVQILKQTGADNVGGPALTRADGYLAQAIALAFHSGFTHGGSTFHDARYEGLVDTVPYGCWRKSTLDRVGLFDETLDRNQDDELNFRIISAGGRIWQSPRIVSWYRPRTRLRDVFRQYFQYGFWKVAVIRKHRRPASWRHLFAWYYIPRVRNRSDVRLDRRAIGWGKLAESRFIIRMRVAGRTVCDRFAGLGSTYGGAKWMALAAYPANRLRDASRSVWIGLFMGTRASGGKSRPSSLPELLAAMTRLLSAARNVETPLLNGRRPFDWNALHRQSSHSNSDSRSCELAGALRGAELNFGCITLLPGSQRGEMTFGLYL